MESRDAVADRARSLADAALAEGATSADVGLLRSAAEMFALAACIGSDANAIQLLRDLSTSMASTGAPTKCACFLSQTFDRFLLQENKCNALSSIGVVIVKKVLLTMPD